MRTANGSTVIRKLHNQAYPAARCGCHLATRVTILFSLRHTRAHKTFVSLWLLRNRLLALAHFHKHCMCELHLRWCLCFNATVLPFFVPRRSYLSQWGMPSPISTATAVATSHLPPEVTLLLFTRSIIHLILRFSILCFVWNNEL